jgi:plasmid stabilization system protein ParE
MDFEIIIEPRAWTDLDDIIFWYENASRGLGKRFYENFENSLNRIKKNPNAFLEIEPSVRRILIKKFPYKLFYTISGNKIFVIGIMHAKRSTHRLK